MLSSCEVQDLKGVLEPARVRNAAGTVLAAIEHGGWTDHQ